tara:strand:- start:440 stop:1345 length:906 start_codon:yes stop_codon:yes gene_type:complete
MTNKILLVDIGGTNIRYAYADLIKKNIQQLQKLPLEDISRFDNILYDLLTEHGCDVLVLSAAGPKINNKIKMTNRNIVFDSEQIKSKYSLSECHLLNDWEAIAYSYEFLKDDLMTIQKGINFNKTSLFFGPGTGLGAAIMIDKKIVLPSELGNTDINVNKFLQNFNILDDSFKKIEDIISGTGISKIYSIKKNENYTSEQLLNNYKDGDKVAIDVINSFTISLAQLLSNLTLAYFVGNGLYLAGGFIRDFSKIMNKEIFIENFTFNNSDTHSDILKKASISVITKEKTPLYGNLYYFLNLK